MIGTYDAEDLRHLAEYARLAAERYDANAVVCAPYPALVHQFHVQACEARALAGRLQTDHETALVVAEEDARP